MRKNKNVTDYEDWRQDNQNIFTSPITTNRKEQNSSASSSESTLGNRAFTKPTCRQTYPALEGGWAWVIVLSCFIIHVLTRGVLFSTGVLFSEWTVYFGRSKSDTAWIGSIATGCALLLGPVTSLLIERWGYRVVALAGGAICTFGLGLSCWAPSVQFLYVSYGICAGSGLGMTYLCGVVAVGEYFNERRSLAFGIAASGAGCGAAIMAISQRILLNEYGWQGTMLLLAGVSGLNQIACGALLRPLSSFLNWRTKESRRRLAIHQGVYSYETSETDTNSNDLTDFSDEKGILKKKEHFFVPGLIESDSTKSITSLQFDDEKLLETQNCDQKSSQAEHLNAEPNNRVRTFSDSRIVNINCASPSILLRNKLKRAYEEDINIRSDGYTNTHFNPGIRLAKSQGHLAQTTNEEYSHMEEKAQHNHTSTTMLRPRLRVGDAMYLSSLSVTSSVAVANEIMSRNTSENVVNAERHSHNISNYKYDSHDSYCSSGSISTNSTMSVCQRNTCEDDCRSRGFENLPESGLNTQILQTKSPSVLKNPLFIMLAVNQFFTGLGVMVPFVHLAEKALLMGISDIRAAYLVSLIGIGNVTGKILLGILCDMKTTDIFTIFLVTQFGIAASVAMFPIFTSYYSLVIASLAFGFFYGNYAAVPSLTAEYVGLRNLGRAMGYINFLEGAAGIIGPPLAGSIYDACSDYNIAFGIAAAFLFVSVLVLLPQPLLYRRTTGRRSSIALWIDKWKFPNTTKHSPTGICHKDEVKTKSATQDHNGNLLNNEKST